MTGNPDDPNAEFDPPARRRRVIFWFVIGVAALAVLALASLPLVSFFGDTDRVARLVDDAGPLAPLVFIGAQIFQVFAAPVPGQVTGFVGGFLFGAGLGALYSTIGGTIGCALVFVLSRRLGRPFVERFVRAKVLKRFDFIAEQNGTLVLLLIFVVPIFPDDLVCYIAGLTRIPILHLVLVAFIGRIPGYIAFSAIGSGAAQSDATLVIVITAVIIVAAGLAFWQRHRLEALLRRLAVRGGDRT